MHVDITISTSGIMIITCNAKPKYSLLLSHDVNISLTEWVWSNVDCRTVVVGVNLNYLGGRLSFRATVTVLFGPVQYRQ